MRPLASRFLAVLALALALLLGGCAIIDYWPATSTTPAPSATGPAASASRAATPRVQPTDAHSGLRWIDASALPREARDTLRLIDRGGPFPYAKDGATFFNNERLLPGRDRGYYREYTVRTPGRSDRGARRIVTGGDREFYWTADHYASFERIRR